jgi:hypothetical protein
MHSWRSQGNARNSAGNLYFQQASIYSYGNHFEIARHVETKRGDAILFNAASYSVTTTRHQSAVRQAIPDSVRVFNVSDLNLSKFFSKDTHKKNVADYESRINAALLKAIRARSSWQKEYSHSSAIALRADRNEYVRFFGLRHKPLPAIPALDSKGLDAIKAKEKQRIKIETEKTKTANAERLARAAVAIENWRKGVGDSYGIPYDAPAMLRIVDNEVQTSKGARIPVSHAKRASVLARAVVSRGEDWQSNGHTCPVGAYKIERISADGTIKAGCHVISRNEWERILPALDAMTVTEEAPAEA